MENSNVKENLEVLFEKFRNMIKVETVVGEAVQIGDTTLVPFVDVTFGFGTGTNHNTANKNHECGGGGGGAKMEPSAILVIKGDRIELFNIKGNPYSSSFDRRNPASDRTWGFFPQGWKCRTSQSEIR